MSSFHSRTYLHFADQVDGGAQCLIGAFDALTHCNGISGGDEVTASAT